MSGYHSVGYRLEIMHTPTGATVELYDADDRFCTEPPLASRTAATADEAVQALINYVTFNLGDMGQEDGDE